MSIDAIIIAFDVINLLTYPFTMGISSLTSEISSFIIPIITSTIGAAAKGTTANILSILSGDSPGGILDIFQSNIKTQSSGRGLIPGMIPISIGFVGVILALLLIKNSNNKYLDDVIKSLKFFNNFFPTLDVPSINKEYQKLSKTDENSYNAYLLARKGIRDCMLSLAISVTSYFAQYLFDDSYYEYIELLLISISIIFGAKGVLNIYKAFKRPNDPSAVFLKSGGIIKILYTGISIASCIVMVIDFINLFANKKLREVNWNF
jgi:hypothetical protein